MMTRREFLATVGLGGAVARAAGGSPAACGKADVAVSHPTAQATATGPSTRRWDLVASEKSPVVQVRSQRLLVGRMVHEPRLAEMVSVAIRQITEKDRDADAWHALLREDDVIGLKFNRSGAEGLATTEPLARLLMRSLTKAGWAPERVVLIEVDPPTGRRLGARPWRQGWQEAATNFGSGADQLAVVLEQVTAIINVPFLKANRLAGMSGCLKNLSHAMIKHPGRFHGSNEADPSKGVLAPGRMCAPYVGDIVAIPSIRDKLRLHLMNALRTCHEPMAEPTGEAVEQYGAILAGRDPVAIDMIGLEILNRQRTARKRPALALPDMPLPQLRSATNAGVGIWMPDGIDHIVVKV
jgi:hypothetical protein